VNDQERYEHAVGQLAHCGYVVLLDEQGYIVRHLTDRDDVSRARNLSDLVEQAELLAWAEQRRCSIKA
jgi:hypothetical protein